MHFGTRLLASFRRASGTLPVAIVALLFPVRSVHAQVTPDLQAPAEPRIDGQEQPRISLSFKDNPSLRIGSNLRFDVHFKSQADWRDFSDQSASGDEFDLNRARIGIDGRVSRYVEYQVERELRSAKRPWRDVFVNVRPLRAAQVQLGHFKMPFSLDQTTSSMDINFAYRSLVGTYLAPGRDVGLMAHGGVFRNRLRYEAGVFRAGGDNARLNEQIDAARQRTIAGRVVTRPWNAARFASLRNLEVGAAFTAGQVPEGLNSLRAETIGGDRFVDRMYVNGLRRRLGAELQWRPGSASVQGEIIRVTEERRGQGIDNENLPDVVHGGWYLSGTWLITGEEKKGNIDPAKPLLQGGFGALEIAGRVEALTFESSSSSGPALPGPRAARILDTRDMAWTLGLNWYVNRFVRVQANAIREQREEGGSPVPALGGSWGRTFRVQFQL
jgi:phosphate-selective porin OprO and OprP